MTAATAAVLLSGCAAPDYTYVRGSDGSTYFKVPSAWRQVDANAFDQVFFGDMQTAKAQIAKQNTWIAAYDAQAARPSANHFLAGEQGAVDQPFVLAKVQKLSDEEKNQVSLDILRNANGLPVAVTADVRKQMESTQGFPFQKFELLSDQVLPAQDGIRGVRTIFNLSVGNGPVQTFDETSFLSADGSIVSTLLIRCSAACFRQQFSEINLVAQSFKVKRLLNQ
ncbi:hypothetical protein ACFFHJ_35870 [Planotetraspora thailandica]|uniref:hypothetical protein n=1 Tax=Planotetraspora thailandica TaxID=487172 RepID=UPI00194E5D6D|nr:hypothetical protein [Planotetraspora thailandica]